jgi:N utilization substance protein B
VTRDESADWAAARSRGREAALQMLYQGEVGRMSPPLVRGVFWQVREDDDTEPGADERAFAERLAEGTTGALERIDPLIEAHSEHWRLSRMSVIDRLVLRLAVYEFLVEPETPRAVVIDEAVELAKRYSTPDAGRFVNGVLDAIRRHLDQEQLPTP